MITRAEQKQISREKILDAAGRRLRSEGLDGAGVAAVMQDAGLTHGAFYSHFSNKDELSREALAQALLKNRQAWMKPTPEENWTQRLKRLARRYLTRDHRDCLEDSCALAALGSEAGRADTPFKTAYEKELVKSLTKLCGEHFSETDPEKQQEALAFMALMVGSITLARAVNSEALSDQLLEAGVSLAEKVTQ